MRRPRLAHVGPHVLTRRRGRAPIGGHQGGGRRGRPHAHAALGHPASRGGGGIAITASHNPAEWNALKLVTGEGIFLDAELSGRFQAYLQNEDPPRVGWDRLGEVVEDGAAWSRHLAAILGLPELDLQGLRARAFTSRSIACTGRGGW